MAEQKSHGKVSRIVFGLACLFCLGFGLIPPLFFGIFNSGVLVLLLGAAFFGALLFFWRRLGGVARRALILLLAVALAALATLSALMLRQGYFAAPPQGGVVPVVVLGGGLRGERPTLMLARRLHTAAAYLRENPGAICVVSGGQGTDEIIPEAHAMANYLQELGIPGERILLEDKSTNTEENLAFSLAVLREQTGREHTEIAIATDGFHQLRASLYARHVGVSTCYSLPARTPWGLMPSYWVREWLALPVAWAVVNLGR